MFKVNKFSLALLILTTKSSLILADTIWLKNGDIIHGKIQIIDDKYIIINTQYAGNINIKTKYVKTFESKQLILTTNKNKIAKKENIEPSKQIGYIDIQNNDATKTLAIKEISLATPSKPVLSDWIWKGSMDVSLDKKNTTKKTKSADIEVRATARKDKIRHNLEGQYAFEQKDHSTTDNYYNLEYSLDYFYTDDIFIKSASQYRNDRIEDLNKKKVIGMGPGYQFWDNAKGALSIYSLLNMNDYKFSNNHTEKFKSLGVGFDFNQYLFLQQLQIYTNGTITHPYKQGLTNEYEINGGLRYMLNDWMSLNFKVKYYKYNAIGGKDNETRYTLGVGVNW